jgi:uncharacterized membrane protein YgcG
MRRFLLLASALVALTVLSAAGAATAKVPPKHKRTSHAAVKAAVKKPAKAKPARAKAKPRHTVVPTAAAPVVDEDDDQVEDQAEDVDNRGPGNAEDDQDVDVDNSGPGNNEDDLDDDNSGPGSSHSGHGGGGGDDHGGGGHGGGGGDD